VIGYHVGVLGVLTGEDGGGGMGRGGFTKEDWWGGMVPLSPNKATDMIDSKKMKKNEYASLTSRHTKIQ